MAACSSEPPYNDEQPYKPPNHLGEAFFSELYLILGDRFVFFRDPGGVLYRPEESALVVAYLDRAVAILQAQGKNSFSEVEPRCSGTGEDETGIVRTIDPDREFLELAGPIAKRTLLEIERPDDT